jgi:hypothetical protein
MKFNAQFQSDLAPIARALAGWRKTRKHRQPIPEPLWTQMAEQARKHGVSPVSQALRLDYYSLKARAAQTPAADFVEVKFAPSGQGPSGCTAEFENRMGGKLLLRWPGTPGPELLGVLQSFLNQGA